MPDLRTLLDDPSAVLGIAPDERTALRVKVAALAAALDACPAAGLASAKAEASVAKDRLLTAEETAALLGVKVRWLYRHAGKLPFTVRLSRKVLRFSEAGVRRFMAKKGLASAGTL